MLEELINLAIVDTFRKEATEESQKAAKEYLKSHDVVLPGASNVNSASQIVKNFTNYVTEHKTIPNQPVIMSGYKRSLLNFLGKHI